MTPQTTKEVALVRHIHRTVIDGSYRNLRRDHGKVSCDIQLFGIWVTAFELALKNHKKRGTWSTTFIFLMQTKCTITSP